MKKLVVFLFLFTFFAQAQDNISFKKFNSFNLNQERILQIYIPESFKENDKNTYPVAVIFDGDLLFDVYVANSKLFAARDKAPEQIVVTRMTSVIRTVTIAKTPVFQTRKVQNSMVLSEMNCYPI